MVWPAIYIAGSVYEFWFLVFLTIAVEALCIKIFLKVSVGKSILISAIGNIVSGLFGTFIMVFGSLLFDGITDLIVKNYSFSSANWFIDYFIMLFGSIFVEIVTVKVIWKYEFKKLLLPLSIGNILSYVLIIVFNNFNIFYKGVT